MTDGLPELGLQEAAAEFCAGFELNPSSPDVSVVRRAFFDTIAVAAAGSTEPSMSALRENVDVVEGPCLIYGTDHHADLLTAVRLNAAAASVLDLDDTSDELRGHPSAVMIPVIDAATQLIGAEPLEQCEAYVVGYRVQRVLARAVDIDLHRSQRWNTASTIARLGAVAALSKLYGFTAEEMMRAFTVAGWTPGTKLHTHEAIPAQTAIAATNAVQAVQLAAAGFGGGEALVPPVPAIWAPREQTASAAFAALRSEQPIMLNIKKYPTCSNLHAAIECLASSELPAASDIASIEICVEPGGTGPLLDHLPATVSEARFSMEYVVAGAILDGRVGLDSFSLDKLREPARQALMQTICVREAPVPETGPGDYDGHFTTIRTTTGDGRTVSLRNDTWAGHAGTPLNLDGLNQKIRWCREWTASHGGSAHHLTEEGHLAS
ncbi:MmgE/PrpD family protein [Brevibacterium sp.]|uniref:MmgE/PrpD family protein n=1 Tax=Brevibacterium sp. TaxID=1701 RepID=UPI002810D422|nr:MmgE/PrpD family protein [Brevibacterium sp.]